MIKMTEEEHEMELVREELKDKKVIL